MLRYGAAEFTFNRTKTRLRGNSVESSAFVGNFH
jgi:hypothetical protein